VGWPTLPDAILSLGGTGSQCPQPLFQPVTAAIAFGGVQPTVVSLQNPGGSGYSDIGSICGSDVRIENVASA